jgi:hypothetical protein
MSEDSDTLPEVNINDQLALISGESASGKSASLRDLQDQEGVMYLNCEAGKRLPFKNGFQTAVVTDPYQVYSSIEYATGNPDFHTIVIDTITFLMDMYESMYIVGSSNTMQGWGDYNQYFKNLMQDYVAKTDKNVLILGHTRSETEGIETKTSVPIKGALKNNGIEAYFSTVVSAKKIKIKDLGEYDPELLHVTEDDTDLGYKHVFQTRLTKATVGERIRSPMGLFNKRQTFMDNDAQLLLNHLKAYYG